MMLKMNLQLFGGNGNSSTGKYKSSGGSKSLTQDEKDAIEYYVSGDGMYINNFLRGRHGYTEADMYSNDKELVKDLDNATNRTLGTETTLYRSVDATAVFGNITNIQYENLVDNIVYGDKQAYKLNSIKGLTDNAIGKTITDKGFMSTSKDYNVASEWGGFSGSDKPIVLELKTKKSTKGVDVSYTDKNASTPQKEVLLARNQKYKILGITAKDGNIYVKAQLQ